METEDGEGRARAARKSKLVMCVDDDQNIRSVINHTLIEAGYTVVLCKSGLECLSMMVRVQPRLVLLDVDMPEMDGFAVCTKINEQFPACGAKIIFLTARRTKNDVEEARRRGGHDFMVKPFAPDRLVKRLDHWIGV